MGVRRGWVLLGLAAACTGTGDTAGDTAPLPVVTDCLSWSNESVVIEAMLGSTADAVVELTNACDRPLAVTLSLPDPPAGYSLDDEDVIMDAGEAIDVRVFFAPVDPEDSSATLRAVPEDADVVDMTILGRPQGPLYSMALQGSPMRLMCEDSIDVTLTNDGVGDGQIVQLSLTGGEAGVDVTAPELPIALARGDSISFEAAVFPPVSAASVPLRLELLDQYVGLVELTESLGVDATGLRQDELAAWSAGRPVDVIVTVDRTMSEPGWKEGVTDGFGALLGALSDEGRDYRVIGLVDPSGCPIGRQKAVAPGEAHADAVSRLVGMLDLDNARGVDDALIHQPFKLVENSLVPENTQTGGCNEWRRPAAPLVTLHVTDEDDESDMSPFEHVRRLRGVSGLADRVAVYAIAGPPGGCETAREGTRLQAAADESGGQLRALCGASWTGAFSAAAKVPGDPQRVALSDPPPWEPSLRVLREGLDSVPATWDGEAAVLPRSIDREETAFTMQYVTEESCQ